MYFVIMAGGEGTRFWPRSRIKTPKQLLKLIGERTMLQSAVDRLEGMYTADNLYVVCTVHQKERIQEQLPFLNTNNLIIEPKSKNTAPCIGLSAILLQQKDPDDVMVVLPSDHVIQNDAAFRQNIREAVELAAKTDCLITIGIEPRYPATAFGYIQLDGMFDETSSICAYKVKTFAEKPDIQTAALFLKSGDFLWNSGIFVWKVSTILNAIKESLPELYHDLEKIRSSLGTREQDEAIHKVYCQIKAISIDYGVMEHAKNVIALRGYFDWRDIGGWDELYDVSAKDENNNAIHGECMTKDVSGCLIDSTEKLVACIDVHDLIIVDTSDALLICPRNKAQQVKDVVDIMKRRNLDNYM
ncbi:mannose-1-phosphate guanylyltransferase [candidate division KSB1 bacterium]|nr:mannose-1-phosphate guanylyltransferase [candidate division KSB1 bacterium]